jgi:metal-sulfur cluster biosynthetic enzyme
MNETIDRYPLSSAPGSPGHELAQNVRAALSTVVDPELGLDIGTLELLRELEIGDHGQLIVRFVFTTPFCPYAGALMAEMERALGEVTTRKIALVSLAEAWTPSDEVKALLGMPGSW